MSTMYDSSVLGTPNNFITFNNYAQSPIFRVRHTLPTGRSIREQDVNLPEGMGVIDYAAYEGKSAFIIDGTMYPKTEDEYYRGREMLRKLGSLEFEQADSYSDQGYVPYKWTEAGRGRQMFVKVMYVDGLGESSNQGFSQPFRIHCKIKYPVIFGTTVKSTTLNTINALTTLGGATIPATIPTAIGSANYTTGTVVPFTVPVVIGAAAGAAGGSVVNEGSIGAYPTIQIYGPVTKPRIQNTTTGEYLELDITVTAGQSCVLTLSQEGPTLIGPDGNSVYNKLTTGSSSSMRVKAGTNNFTFSGSSLGTNAYATVNFLDAYPMS